jgi:thioredoxin-like negative regulator of GroEL
MQRFSRAAPLFWSIFGLNGVAHAARWVQSLKRFQMSTAQKIKIVKLNTDEESAIAIKYGITSIPSMYVFVNGEVVTQIVGAKPKPALLKDLASYLA